MKIGFLASMLQFFFQRSQKKIAHLYLKSFHKPPKKYSLNSSFTQQTLMCTQLQLWHNWPFVTQWGPWVSPLILFRVHSKLVQFKHEQNDFRAVCILGIFRLVSYEQCSSQNQIVDLENLWNWLGLWRIFVPKCFVKRHNWIRNTNQSQWNRNCQQLVL